MGLENLNDKFYFDEIRKVDKFVVKDIRNKIKSLEEERGIRILHTCITGSRSYGLENKTSDYDLRIIYANTPDWYFKLGKADDTFVEKDGVLDIAGFNLQKAVKFVIDSNAGFQEIIRSPLQIDTDLEFYSRFRRYCKEFHNPIKIFYHYENFARGAYRDFINDHLDNEYLTPKMIKTVIHLMRCTMAKTLCKKYGDIPLTFGVLLMKADIDSGVKNEIREFFHFINSYQIGDSFIQAVNLVEKLNKINVDLKCSFQPRNFNEKDLEPINNFHQRVILRGYKS